MNFWKKMQKIVTKSTALLHGVFLFAVIGILDFPAYSQKQLENYCEMGAELARRGDYDGALFEWRRPLSPDIEYKMWLQKNIQCLRRTGLASSDAEIIAWFRRSHENGSLDGTVQYAWLLAFGFGEVADVGQAREILDGAVQRGSHQASTLLKSLDLVCKERPAHCDPGQ